MFRVKEEELLIFNVDEKRKAL